MLNSTMYQQITYWSYQPCKIVVTTLCGCNKCLYHCIPSFKRCTQPQLCMMSVCKIIIKIVKLYPTSKFYTTHAHRGINVYIHYVTEPAKTGLVCTSNCTHSVNHNFSCEVANNTTLTPFTVLCLISLLSNL